MFSSAEIAQNYMAVGKAKTALPFLKALILGVFAGVFIALAGVGAGAASVSIASASAAKLVGACVFPGGLAMVVITGSELFTGNCLLVMPALNGAVTFRSVIKAWIIVYIGNLIGSILVAALCAFGHVYSMFGGAFAESVAATAAAKVNLTFSDAFLRGILCNFLVCIAVWIAMGAKSTGGKILGLFFPIMLFVVSGFEHSVANMYYISAGLFAELVPSYGLEAASGLTWGAFFVKNLLPVTLGNIVGGSVCVGLPFWYFYLSGSRKKAD